MVFHLWRESSLYVQLDDGEAGAMGNESDRHGVDLKIPHCSRSPVGWDDFNDYFENTGRFLGGGTPSSLQTCASAHQPYHHGTVQ
jgi:hypothetical protein